MTSNEPQIEQDDYVETSVLTDRLAQLKQLYPEAFREGELDIEALRLVVGAAAEGETQREHYDFTWAGKREAILAVPRPAQASLLPMDEESVDAATTANYFIEGENLTVLKLLYKAYTNRVKLIYIDPPYNTGNDFVYPDNFREPLQQYLRVTGQLDADGNTTSSELDRNGHKHSTWLTMMYPRLLLARQMLRPDGVIFVSIDDTEVANLRLLMDEVFGEENFIASIAWQKKFSPQNDATYFSDMHDYIVIYAKQAKTNKTDKQGWSITMSQRTEEQNARYSNPDSDPRGNWSSSDLSVRTYSAAYDYPITAPSGRIANPSQGRSWSMPKERFEELRADNRIWFGENGNNAPRIKRFLSDVQEGIVPVTWWPRDKYGDNQEAKQEMKALLQGVDVVFDTPKPVRLLKAIIQLATTIGDGDIILDFFAGSGTAAQAVLELNREDGGNRRFIMVQLPEPTGNADYPSIAEIGKERIRRVIARMQAANAGKLPLEQRDQPEDLGFRVFREVASSYKRWQPVTQQDYLSKLKEQHEPLTAGWQTFGLLWELALREGYGLATTITDLGGDRYRVADPEREQAMVVSLAGGEAATFDPTLMGDATLFLCRDIALTDTQLANLKLQAKAAGVRFRTI